MITRFESLGYIDLGHIRDVFGDERFYFHLESSGKHKLDFFLPGLLVLEPGIVGDLFCPCDVTIRKFDLHVIG